MLLLSLHFLQVPPENRRHSHPPRLTTRGGRRQGHRPGPALLPHPVPRLKPALPSPKLHPWRTKGGRVHKAGSQGQDCCANRSSSQRGPSGTQQASPGPGRAEAQLEANRPPPGRSGQRALSAQRPAGRHNQGPPDTIWSHSLFGDVATSHSVHIHFSNSLSHLGGPAPQKARRRRWWSGGLPPQRPASTNKDGANGRENEGTGRAAQTTVHATVTRGLTLRAPGPLRPRHPGPSRWGSQVVLGDRKTRRT